jgi:hypothetical protein
VKIRANSDGSKPSIVRLSQEWAAAKMPSYPCGAEMELDGERGESLRGAA